MLLVCVAGAFWLAWLLRVLSRPTRQALSKVISRRYPMFLFAFFWGK